MNKFDVFVIVIGDMLTRCTLFVCVTVAAIHFDNWRILLLCLFALLFSHRFETRQTIPSSHDSENYSDLNK